MSWALWERMPQLPKGFQAHAPRCQWLGSGVESEGTPEKAQPSGRGVEGGAGTSELRRDNVPASDTAGA